MGRFSGVVRTKAGVLKPVPISEVPEKRIGRPPGKRTDPKYRQVSAWLRKDTYGQVRAKLYEGGDSKEFSGLVQELLEKWLSGK